MQLTVNESQTDIAKELGISDWTVRRVASFASINSSSLTTTGLPRHTIAFDDFKSGRALRPVEPSMILMNIENHRTLDIILSRRRGIFSQVLSALRPLGSFSGSNNYG
uniref:transposase family protein n=1 Tax=Lactiplantibacillus plantarum TaxID=1590 RepID=UPI00280BB8A6|nr:transposase family protein [Lactiplantibacillus plantarum]